jgi:nucleotide-binding universal stress UspA family protein
MTMANPTILAGVDGSAGSDQAVRWATALAVQRDYTLHVVHALEVAKLYYYVGDIAGKGALEKAVGEDGEQIVRNAVEVARSVDGGVTVTTETSTQPPVPLLIELSRDARMLVLGHAGRGGFGGMLVGSIASAVASHAHCPVAVIRDTGSQSATGPIVVGLDGSPTSELAIAAAFDEASFRNAPLVAVHAWSDVTYDDVNGTARFPFAWKSLEDDELRLLAQRLAGWQEKYPDVEVRRELVRDRPRHALLGWSEQAQLVVVGSRGRGGFRGMLLGSTSQALVRHARCPVLVVRPEATADAERE